MKHFTTFYLDKCDTKWSFIFVFSCDLANFQLITFRRCISEADCRRISAEILAIIADVESLRMVDNVCQVGCPAGMEKGKFFFSEANIEAFRGKHI